MKAFVSTIDIRPHFVDGLFSCTHQGLSPFKPLGGLRIFRQVSGHG